MSEFPSPLCPKDCLFLNVPIMCTVDCSHRQDRMFKKPQPIRVCGKDTEIIGRNGDKLILKDKTTISVKAPFIDD